MTSQTTVEIDHTLSYYLEDINRYYGNVDKYPDRDVVKFLTRLKQQIEVDEKMCTLPFTQEWVIQYIDGLTASLLP